MKAALLPALVAALAAAGCVAGSDDYRTLARGGQSGIHDGLEAVITDAAAWQEFWSGHVSNQTEPPAAPAVNFEQERVVAVLLGPKPNACWGVEIVRVTSDRVAETTLVQYAVREPSPDKACAQVITYPHHVVAIPKAPTEVRFERVDG